MNGDLGQSLINQIREMSRNRVEESMWRTEDLMYLVGWIEALRRDKRILEEGIDKALKRADKLIEYLSETE